MILYLNSILVKLLIQHLNVYKNFRNKLFHIDKIYKKFYTHISLSTMVILELCIELYS